MSLADWVQLFRNGLCVVRTFAPKDSFIFRVPYPNSRYPLTLIDAAIVSTQVPAIYFFGAAGLQALYSSSEDVEKYKKLLIAVDRHPFDDIDVEEGFGPELVSAVLRHALTNELTQARRQFKIGVSKLLVSIAFVLFSLNTLGIKLSRHPMSVINGVALLLTGLSYMLYAMAVGMWTRYSNAAKAKKLKKRLRNSSNGNSLEEIVNLVYRAGYGENLHDALLALTASQESGESPVAFEYKGADITDYEAVVESDLDTIAAALKGLKDQDATDGTKGGATPQRNTRSRARAAAATSQAPAALLRALEAYVHAQHRALGLTAAFFALNAAAGYGYLMPVLAYYLPHEGQPAGSVVGAILNLLTFTLPSAVADWRGGVVGDVAWTLEPLLVFAAPTLLKIAEKMQSRGRHGSSKAKSD